MLILAWGELDLEALVGNTGAKIKTELKSK